MSICHHITIIIVLLSSVYDCNSAFSCFPFFSFVSRAKDVIDAVTWHQ